MYQNFTTKIIYNIKGLPSISPNTEPLWSEFFHMPNEKCEALRAPLRRDRHSAGLLGNDLLLILCPCLPAPVPTEDGAGRDPAQRGDKRHAPVTPWKENTETTEGAEIQPCHGNASQNSRGLLGGKHKNGGDKENGRDTAK